MGKILNKVLSPSGHYEVVLHRISQQGLEGKDKSVMKLFMSVSNEVQSTAGPPVEHQHILNSVMHFLSCE